MKPRKQTPISPIRVIRLDSALEKREARDCSSVCVKTYMQAFTSVFIGNFSLFVSSKQTFEPISGIHPVVSIFNSMAVLGHQVLSP